MTVKEFIKCYIGLVNTRVVLYDLNKNIECILDTDRLKADDDLYNDWKDTTIVGWELGNNDDIWLNVC